MYCQSMRLYFHTIGTVSAAVNLLTAVTCDVSYKPWLTIKVTRCSQGRVDIAYRRWIEIQNTRYLTVTTC